jgi:putative MATE family efflux protein
MSKPGTSIEASGRAAEVRLGGYLAGLSLPRQVLVLAVWPLLEQILAFVVGLTDLLIAGRMVEGAERVVVLDAMALGGYVSWFLHITQAAVATGVMALVSRATGAKDFDLANRGLGQAIWMGVAAGATAMVALLAGLRFLVAWMDLSPEAADSATRYLGIIALSAPLSGAVFAINAALRGSGDTRTPFFAMAVVNAVNIAASLLLVFGPSPWGGHGIEGIAWGTVMGWAVGLVVCILLVPLRKNGVLAWRRDCLKPHLDTMRRIIRVGAPQALEIAGMWGIHAFGIRIISGLPVEGALGSHILAIRIESLSFLPGFAIATAAAALAGQYLGAGSQAMAVSAVRFSWVLAFSLMSAMGMFFFLARDHVIGWMVPGSAEHIALAGSLMIVCAIGQPFFATCIILKTSMRGAGATHLVMRWAFASMIFYRIGVLHVMDHYQLLDLTRVWMVMTCDTATQAGIFIWLHLRGDWLKARV